MRNTTLTDYEAELALLSVRFARSSDRPPVPFAHEGVDTSPEALDSLCQHLATRDEDATENEIVTNDDLESQVSRLSRKQLESIAVKTYRRLFLPSGGGLDEAFDPGKEWSYDALGDIADDLDMSGLCRPMSIEARNAGTEHCDTCGRSDIVVEYTDDDGMTVCLECASEEE